MPKIIYNKAKSGRLLGGGGPRDRQVALKLKQQQELFSGLRPAITAEVSKSKTVSGSKQIQQEVNLSQYLPLKEVKKKIEEAVTFTRNKEQQRFESGLKNINNQLKVEREKLAKSEAVVKRLQDQLCGVTVLAGDKEEFYSQSSKDIRGLQDKLDRLYNKISDGSIQHLVGSKMDRPMLEDKIFIDPLEKGKEPDLDAHIDITGEESVDQVDSDMMADLSKLKGLLNLN